MSENETTDLAERTDVPLAEAIMSTDAMYAIIGKTKSALKHTTVDGLSADPIDAELQAQPNKKYLPDTEVEMLQSQAVPMSDVDIKVQKEIIKYTTSVQYRQKQLSIPTMTLAEITGARVRIAYRLVRYMSHVRGIGQVGLPLIFSMGAKNPQVNLFELPLPYDPTRGWYRGLSAVRNLLATIQESDYQYTYLIDDAVFTAKGMSILPPPIHDGYYPADKETWQCRREQYVPESYRGDTDAPLAIYLNICELLVRHLGIGEISVEEQAAVAAMLNPKISRLSWPCSDEIETFEEYILLPYIGRILVKKSQDNTIKALKEDMSLTHAEAFDMVEMYKTYAREINTFDPEMERSPMLSRLQNLEQDCGEAGMVTTQLNTIKASAQILGLTKHEEESNVDRKQALSGMLEAEIVGQKKTEQIAGDAEQV